jgi:hypothetical protein
MTGSAICGTAARPACRFAHAGYDPNTTPRSRDGISPEFCKLVRPQKNRGRREDRVRAAPAISCANRHIENAHEHTGSAEAVRPSLRNGVTAYIVLSPARPGLFATVAPKKRELLKNLTPAIGASGPHDFAVRSSCARQSQLSRPSLPDPRFVTNAHTPLWWDGMAQEVKLICLRDQA